LLWLSHCLQASTEFPQVAKAEHGKRKYGIFNQSYIDVIKDAEEKADVQDLAKKSMSFQ
jgi:hypothetical protein